MADNTIEKPTPDQQATEVIDKLRAGKRVEGPLTPEVKRLATEKIQTLEASLQAPIRAALDSLKIDTENTQAATVASKSKEEMRASVDDAIDSIDMRDIGKMKQGLDKLRLALNIPGLSPSDKDAILGYTGKMLIVRIEQAGYKIYLSSDRKVIVEPSTPTGDRTTSTALATMLNQDPSNIQSIAIGLLYNSSQFANFVAINTSEIDGKKAVQNPNTDYFKYLREAQSGKKTTSDEALMRSESTIRTTLGLTPDKMQSLMTGHMNTGDWLRKNPVVAQQVAQAVATQPTTNGVNSATTAPQAHSSSSRPTTWKENPIGKAFGEAGTSVMNGIGDLMSEPGALTGVIITFIATWIFADFKTALGVLGVATGASAAYDAYKRNKDGISAQSAPAQSQAQNPASAPQSVPKMDHTIDISKKGPNEKKLWENLQKTKSITNALDNRQEKLATYMEFIDKNSLLNKTIGDLIYVNPHEQSIFSNKAGLPQGFPQLPNGMNSVVLKRIIRVLVSGVDRYPATDIDGEEHTKNYKEWVLGKAEANKIKDEDWKKKGINDIIPDIAKKF